MKMPSDIGIKIKEKIASRYPTIDKIQILEKYAICPTDYRKDEIEKYDVIYWHRLLRSIYEGPLEIECNLHSSKREQRENIQTASFRKTLEKNKWEVIGIDEKLALELEMGTIKPLPVNWKYLVSLPSGRIVELGTKDRNTIFSIAQVSPTPKEQKQAGEEVKKFIDRLLDEANRLKGQLFNPIKEFEKQEHIRLYLLFNVYLSNYLSAKTMLSIADYHEKELQKECLRFDARTSDLHDADKVSHINQHLLTCGMFYCSSIAYFFMSIEGFVNLVFHVFLKKKFRDKEFNAEQRFDLEQKLRLMPDLCDGFKENSKLPATIISEFKKLKKYRNSLFHAKVEDSLKGLCFIEDGFLYNYDMDKFKDSFLPAYKIKLTTKDVLEVNSVVDEIVKCILASMQQNVRMVTETYILKEVQIPINVLETGEIVVGERKIA